MAEQPDEQYPEHDKMRAVLTESNTIGAFLEMTGYVLAEYDTYVNSMGVEQTSLVAVSKSIPQVLAEYFDIDLNKIETEKREMLRRLAERNA